MSQPETNAAQRTPLEPADGKRAVRAAAFRLLLETGVPVDAQRLCQLTGLEHEQLNAVLDDLLRHGDMRLDAQKRIVGVAGLSVTPDRHMIHIAGRTFWTWCAYDIVGIFGSLEASGTATSVSPATGQRLELEFHNGSPQSSDVVVFRPDPTDPPRVCGLSGRPARLEQIQRSARVSGRASARPVVVSELAVPPRLT
jgi:hypothetical protein